LGVSGIGCFLVLHRLHKTESQLGECVVHQALLFHLTLPRVFSPAASPADRWCGASAPPRCLDGGDVDLLHRHHRLEGTLCLTATSRKRVG
jgi:hypothetical protein